MNVPRSTRHKIRSQFHSDGERKTALLRVYLTEHPHPTWEHVSGALYRLTRGQYHSVLERLQSMFPTGESVHEHFICIYMSNMSVCVIVIPAIQQVISLSLSPSYLPLLPLILPLVCLQCILLINLVVPVFKFCWWQYQLTWPFLLSLTEMGQWVWP